MDHQAARTFVGVGVYSVHQAARLSGVPARSIRRWLMGYSYRYRDAVTRQPPVIAAELAASDDGVLALSFRDLIEIRFVYSFRELGVSWKVIRLAAEKARSLFQTDHPFTTEAFFSDGRAIFAQLQDEGVQERRLVDLVSDQYCFRNVMLPSFRAQIELSPKGAAERWWPLGRNKKIVLDPARQFGQPIVDDQAVPTAVLAKATAVMGSEQLVAKWYDVPRASVHQAVLYERQLAAA